MSAAPTRGWASSTARTAAALLALPLLIGAAPPARLEVGIANLRSDAGDLRLCLTRESAHFPDCSSDPQARRLVVPAAAEAIAFSDLPSGGYALSVIHDENANRRLDTFARIPREGFGFSRNPALRFGPPRFDQVRFTIGTGAHRQNIRMNYLL